MRHLSLPFDGIRKKNKKGLSVKGQSPTYQQRERRRNGYGGVLIWFGYPQVNMF